uniref:Ras-related protein RABF2a n=2 Tax=Lygus hesperus TaxID=30085 RepID=A0A0A9XSY7_LYGHE
MYYRGAAAALIMYDIADRQSYENAKTWIIELQHQGSSNVIVAFVGNKVCFFVPVRACVAAIHTHTHRSIWRSSVRFLQLRRKSMRRKITVYSLNPQQKLVKMCRKFSP